MDNKKLFIIRRNAEEKNQSEALSNLTKIGWKLYWEPRFKTYRQLIGDNHNASILDLGSGMTSSFLRLLKQDGFNHLTGFDLTKSSQTEAKKYGLKIVVGDLEEDILEKLENKKYDFIILSEVIEHLYYPDKVLQKIGKLLRQNGKLIISTPNSDFWTNAILKKFFPRYLKYFSTAYGTDEHLNFYTYNSLKILLDKVGYKVTGIRAVPQMPRKIVRKEIYVKIIVLIENCAYKFSNLFVKIKPGKFSQFIIFEAGLKK